MGFERHPDSIHLFVILGLETQYFEAPWPVLVPGAPWKPKK